MKIATKTGDKGTTGLLFGTRVYKNDVRVIAVGEIDELCAAIGLVRPELIKKKKDQARYVDLLSNIQHKLTWFMGELVAESNDRYKFLNRFDHIKLADMEELDEEVELLQNMPELEQKHWVQYGATELGARLDYASKVCRRAERAFISASEEVKTLQQPYYRPVLGEYINRLSDLLYLLARYMDFVYSSKDTKRKEYTADENN